MKKIATLGATLISSAVLISAAHAATPGSYAGIGIGAGRIEIPNNFISNTTAQDIKAVNGTLNQSRKMGGLAGRIFGGYNFNEYFGLEAGFDALTSSEYKAHANFPSELLGGGRDFSFKNKYSVKALDVVGKGYLPIYDSGFNVYGLGGVAYVRSKQESTLIENISGAQTEKTTGTTTTNKIRPVAGLGVSYDIKDTGVGTQLEFRHIQGSGNVKTSASAIPNVNMVTFGVTYNFG